MEKVAILVDSGSDISTELIEKMGIRVLPLKIIYGDEVYSDGVDIQPRMVYDRFPKEIPTTSTPNFAEITAAAESLREEGYNKILAICISSGLSSTWQNISTALSEVEGVEYHAVDTKNISIGAGVLALYASMLLRKGHSFEETWRKVEENVEHSRIFYYMDTLDYLRAGGRIGRVTGVIGSLLNIKPIISCNKQGIYHTVSMIRGQKRGLKKLVECVAEHYEEGKEAFFAVMNGDAHENAQEIVKQLKERFPKGKVFMEKQINASLAVHTGPGLVGILLFQPTA